MDFSQIDMKKEFAYYNKIAPVRKARLSGGVFRYRYYRNPSPEVKATIVMLAGGSGMADGFFTIARSFMKRYSLISFTYPIDFKGNEATADAIAELIKHLKAENVYYWGQSYGGLMAQMIAKRHPEVVKGLLLTSTASLSNDIGFEGMECMVGMLNAKKEQKRYQMYQKFPMSLLPVVMNLAFKKHLKDKPEAYQAVKDMMEQLKPDMTKEYFCHMTSLLADLRNHMGKHHKEDFAFLKGRVLIIEPDDDNTFTEDIKEALINIMPSPAVVRKIEGGHLAMIFNPDAFLKIINNFMDSQELS